MKNYRSRVVEGYSPLYSMSSLVLVTLCVFTLSISVSGQSTCLVEYGNWTACRSDGTQQRTIACICDNLPTDTATCLAHRITLEPIVRDCDGQSDTDDDEENAHPECQWKWTRWTRCTAPCGGGNTSRSQVCICEGREGPAPGEWCDEQGYYGNETCDCNVYVCGSVPAFNKIYWVNQLPDWPLNPNTRFNCSLGYDKNTTDTPHFKTYARVLSDAHPEQHSHFEWYYLAKEYITIRLNIANGVKLPSSSLEVVDSVGKLLEDCTDWPADQKYAIFGDKEKLGRLNNNIGGLANVDAQMAILEGNSGNDLFSDNSENSENSGTLALTIIIPVIAALLIGIAVGLTVYYVKEKKNVVVEQAAFESEDEPSEEGGAMGGDQRGVHTVPLETDTAGQGTAGQMVETQQHSDSEDHQ